MTKHILLLLLLITNSKSFSQSAIKSTIKDQNNNPIPFASIYLPDSKKSTMSNEDGEFYLVINPEIDKTVIISHLSYESVQLKLEKDLPKVIVLKEGAFQMEELVIGNQLSSHDIALKVIENLEENHDADPAYYEYFTRIANYTQDWKTVNLIQEYYGKLEHTDGHNTKAIIKKSRAIPYNEAGEELYKTETTMGLWGIRSDNLLLYKPAFLKKSKLKKYTIELEGSININGIDCYILKYTNEDGEYSDDIKAMAYVDKETFAFVKLITRNHQTQTGSYLERNFINTGSKWVLSTATEKHRNNSTTTLYNYLANKKDYANEDFTRTPFNERIKRYNKDLNDTFWENYQHIPLPEN